MSGLLKIVGEQKSSCCASVALNISPARDAAGAEFRGRAAVVTLGCAKNQVDSEVMLGVLRNSGFEITNQLADADVAVVNTCGFLESAVRESVDAILEVAEHKTSGRLRKLIVAGCMVSRYREDLTSSMPEVDAFISVDDILKVGAVASGSEVVDLLAAAERPYFLYDDSMPRHLSTRPHTAYVKVSEGCNRPCTFCIIPKIRGAMRSRSIQSVVQEVAALGAQGVREVNIVAQDLTSFGTDTKEGTLVDLLRALDAAGSVDWIRLLYAYPIGIDAELLRAVAELPRLCKYLDLPLQHSSISVLKAMKRPVGRYSAREITEFIRKTAPELAIRTTFIVGFPGETETDIADLEAFVGEGHFTSVGVFTYSQEAGTPAGEMPDQISEKEKRARRDRVMRAQQAVVTRRIAEMVGRVVPVLIEGPHEESDLLWAGRMSTQAPEVDGQIIVNDIADGEEPPQSGEIRLVELTEVAGYDLIGKVVGTVEAPGKLFGSSGGLLWESTAETGDGTSCDSAKLAGAGTMVWG